LHGRLAHRTWEATCLTSTSIQLGREWTDQRIFSVHLEGRPNAWQWELDRQLLADAMPRTGDVGQGTVEIPLVDPLSPGRRLIQAKRARIRGVVQARTLSHQAA
jgi:hypothetical protein